MNFNVFFKFDLLHFRYWHHGGCVSIQMDVCTFPSSSSSLRAAVCVWICIINNVGVGSSHRARLLNAVEDEL